MTYTDPQVSAANAAMEKYRGGDNSEVGSTLLVVALSAERDPQEKFRSATT